MNRDSLTNMSPDDAARASMKVIDTMQSMPPEQQIAGAAATFTLLCERLGVAPQDAYSVVTNIMSNADSDRRPEFRAVKNYLESEV